MNKKAKQLRELRNKTLYNGDVPLEVGTELQERKENGLKTYIGRVRYDGTVEVINWHNWETKEEIKLNYKILGKPTSWGDILRMLNAKENEGLVMGRADDEWALGDSGELYEQWGHYGTPYFKTKSVLKFDLTRSLEEQDEEVLNKLIKIIE